MTCAPVSQTGAGLTVLGVPAVLRQGLELGLGPEGGAEGRSHSASTPDGPAPEKGTPEGAQTDPEEANSQIPFKLVPCP